MYVTPYPDWFVLYGITPSNWWDATHQRWYRLRLGWDKRGTTEQQKASFCCYLWAWEAPYTSTRRVALDIPLFHAELVPPEFGAGLLWAIGDDASGRDVSLPIWEASSTQLLAVDDLPFPAMDMAHVRTSGAIKNKLWSDRPR